MKISEYNKISDFYNLDLLRKRPIFNSWMVLGGLLIVSTLAGGVSGYLVTIASITICYIGTPILFLKFAWSSIEPFKRESNDVYVLSKYKNSGIFNMVEESDFGMKLFRVGLRYLLNSVLIYAVLLYVNTNVSAWPILMIEFFCVSTYLFMVAHDLSELYLHDINTRYLYKDIGKFYKKALGSVLLAIGVYSLTISVPLLIGFLVLVTTFLITGHNKSAIFDWIFNYLQVGDRIMQYILFDNYSYYMIVSVGLSAVAFATFYIYLIVLKTKLVEFKKKRIELGEFTEGHGSFKYSEPKFSKINSLFF